MLNGMAGRLAYDVEFSLQRVGHHDVVAAADEQLTYHGLTGADGGRHRHVAIHRYVTPTQYDLALVAHGTFEFLFTGQSGGHFLGQEHHGHAVFIGWRQFNTLRGHFFTIQAIRYLYEYACAVSHEFVGPDRTAVVQVFEDLESLLDDGVAFISLDVRHETDATGIVFMGGAIQALGRWGEAGYLQRHRHGRNDRRLAD